MGTKIFSYENYLHLIVFLFANHLPWIVSRCCTFYKIKKEKKNKKWKKKKPCAVVAIPSKWAPLSV